MLAPEHLTGCNSIYTVGWEVIFFPAAQLMPLFDGSLEDTQ